MPHRKSTPLSHDQFGLLGFRAWEPHDVPLALWPRFPKLTRLHDAFAVVGSGCPIEPVLRDGQVVVAGLDVLCYEAPEGRRPGEPAGNAYHHDIVRSGHSVWPYLLLPVRLDGAVVRHWFDEAALDAFLDGTPLR